MKSMITFIAVFIMTIQSAMAGEIQSFKIYGKGDFKNFLQIDHNEEQMTVYDCHLERCRELGTIDIDTLDRYLAAKKEESRRKVTSIAGGGLMISGAIVLASAFAGFDTGVTTGFFGVAMSCGIALGVEFESREEVSMKKINELKKSCRQSEVEDFMNLRIGIIDSLKEMKS